MTKEKLIPWMQENGLSNEWLAEKCGVKLPTINSWRSNRPIPAKAALIIQTLMDNHQRDQLTADNKLNITLTDHQLDTIEHAAAIVQTPMRDYIIRAATARARQDIELTKLHVAEDEALYKTKGKQA